MSNPQYAQSVLLTQAVWETLQAAKTRLAQTDPASLGSFSWRIDAKDRKLTEYERTWSELVLPMVQTLSLERGWISVAADGFDYSAMAPFNNPTLPEAPAHLAGALPQGRTGPWHTSDVRKIMADLRFEDSRTNTGLRLADILVNAFRRALSGRLRERGWRRLGQLLVVDFRGGTTAKYVSLTPRSESPPALDGPAARIAVLLHGQARPWEVKRGDG
jgi:hypothetical protein